MTHKKTDWLFDSWLYSSSDWALADRIERIEHNTTTEPAAAGELKALKGEHARRIALKLLAPSCYCYNQPIHMYTGQHHLSNSVEWYRYGHLIIDQYTKSKMDLIIRDIKAIDPKLFDYLVDRLPDSFIDPIIIKAEESNDCVYLVGDKAIGD